MIHIIIALVLNFKSAFNMLCILVNLCCYAEFSAPIFCLFGEMVPVTFLRSLKQWRSHDLWLQEES